MCGKNSGTSPNNILADGYPLGTAVSGPVTVDSMCINCANPSTFQFSQLMIWNQALRYAHFFSRVNSSFRTIPTVLPSLIVSGQVN